MLTILLYIAFRFEFGFGVGAMVSTLHDILMTIGIFVLSRAHKFSAPMVAAILCIAGLLDQRDRRRLRPHPRGAEAQPDGHAARRRQLGHQQGLRPHDHDVVDHLPGGPLALRLRQRRPASDISFTFLVGIVTSTFSAIFVAAQVFYWWHKGDRKHVEAHSDVAPKYEWTGSSKASR